MTNSLSRHDLDLARCKLNRAATIKAYCCMVAVLSAEVCDAAPSEVAKGFDIMYQARKASGSNLDDDRPARKTDCLS